MVVAFNPQSLGQPVSEGSRCDGGGCRRTFHVHLLLVLTAIYVQRANGEFDTLTQEIVKKPGREPIMLRTADDLAGPSRLQRPGLAADAVAQTEKQATNRHAIIMFCISWR
jgi:hypothetical protein